MDEHSEHPQDFPAPAQGDFQAPSAPEQVDRLELVEPSFWTRGMTTTGVLLLVAAFWFSDAIVQILQAPLASWRMLALVLLAPLSFVVYALWRWWDLPDEARAVVFDDELVHLPVSADSKRTVDLPYDEVCGILSMTRGQGDQAVLVDTGSQTIAYSDGDFARDEGVQVFTEELHRRVGHLPNSDEIFDRMRGRQKLARIASSKPIPVTKALLGILAAYFSVELFTGALDSQLGLIRLGANAPALIEQGQYWRLISANFLHNGWIHIIFNGIALYFLGAAIEKMLGSWRMLLIYLVGALAGSVGSWIFGPGALSVGSSTAIFGLFGAFLAVHLRYWRQLPPPFRQSVGWWVFIVAINSALPVIMPVIDYAAHLAGLVAGVAVTFALLAPMPELKPDRKASKFVKAVAGVLSAITVAGLVQAGVYALGEHPGDREDVYAGMIDDALSSDAAPEQINAVAWQMGAVNPDAKKWQLEKSHAALKKVIDRADEPRMEFRDTLATLDYRLAKMSTGQTRLDYIDRAINLERDVFAQANPGPAIADGGKQTYASQLARFLEYRRRIAGPLVRSEAAKEAPAVRFDAADKSVAVDAPEAPTQPVAIYATVRTGEALDGLAKICLNEGQAKRTIAGADAVSDWSKKATLDTALVEPDAECNEAIEFWPMSDEVAGYP